MKNVEILTSLKPQQQIQPLRKIKFIERYLDDDSNYQQQGFFKVQLENVQQQLIKHATYIVDPEYVNQLLSDQVRHPICRLPNQGASCYANAAIQAILAITSLRTLIFSEYYEKLLSPVVKAIRGFAKSPGAALQQFVQTLPVFGFSPYQQADSSELFLKILQHFHSQECEYQKVEISCETSAIDQILSFTVQQQIQCKRCGGLTSSQFLSRTVMLKIKQTLKKAFLDYLRPVSISGYQCDFCGKDADIAKATEICSAGRVFIVQLQRWNAEMRRINSNIRVPEKLQLAGGVTPRNIEAFAEASGKSNLAQQVIDSINISKNRYSHQLKAVICHQGIDISSGHYVCYVFDGAWKLYDDETVTNCKFDDVQTQDAVLLVYEEIETHRPAKLVKVAEKGAQAIKEVKNEDFGEQVADQAVAQQEGQPEARTLPFQQDELLDQQALSSEILHSKQTEMDADIDKAKKRKTQAMRDQNREIREQEIKERRAAKYEKWIHRQKYGKFGTKGRK